VKAQIRVIKWADNLIKLKFNLFILLFVPFLFTNNIVKHIYFLKLVLCLNS
jgi:hypothetical protein